MMRQWEVMLTITGQLDQAILNSYEKYYDYSSVINLQYFLIQPTSSNSRKKLIFSHRIPILAPSISTSSQRLCNHHLIKPSLFPTITRMRANSDPLMRHHIRLYTIWLSWEIPFLRILLWPYPLLDPLIMIRFSQCWTLRHDPAAAGWSLRQYLLCGKIDNIYECIRRCSLCSLW